MGRNGSIRSAIFERGIQVGIGFWVFLGVALIVGSAPVVLAMLLAAAAHESGHLIALALFGVPVEGIRLGAMGAVIRARGIRFLSYGRELCVTLAGPAVNLFCAALFAVSSKRYGWEWGLLFAGCHAVLGVYNLLPIPPLDGARALYLMTAFLFAPETGARVSAGVGLLCATALSGLGAYLALRRGGSLLLFAALGLLVPQLRKR